MKEKIAKFMARPITYGDCAKMAVVSLAITAAFTAFGTWKVNRSAKAMDDASFPDEDLEGDEE